MNRGRGCQQDQAAKYRSTCRTTEDAKGVRPLMCSLRLLRPVVMPRQRENLVQGQQGERRGEAACGEVGVHQQQGGAGHGQCPPGGQQGNARPLRPGLGWETATREAECGIEQQHRGEEIEAQQHVVQRSVAEANQARHRWSKQGVVGGSSDERAVQRKERRLQEQFYAGQVETAILSPGMKAVHQQNRQRQQSQAEYVRAPAVIRDGTMKGYLHATA